MNLPDGSHDDRIPPGPPPSPDFGVTIELEYSVDELSDSTTEDDVSSIFTATSSNDSGRENEHSARISVTVEVQVRTTRILGRDGVVPGDKVSLSNGNYRSQSFRYAILSHNDYALTFAVELWPKQLTSYTRLYGSLA